MTATDVTETRPIIFHEREIQTLKPTKEQLAILVRLSRLKPAAETSTERQIAQINRLPLLVSAMFADEADWDWVEDGLAETRFQWEEVIDIAVLITKLWYAEGEASDEDNRAARRRAPRKAAKVIEGTARRTT